MARMLVTNDAIDDTRKSGSHLVPENAWSHLKSKKLYQPPCTFLPAFLQIRCSSSSYELMTSGLGDPLKRHNAVCPCTCLLAGTHGGIEHHHILPQHPGLAEMKDATCSRERLGDFLPAFPWSQSLTYRNITKPLWQVYYQQVRTGLDVSHVVYPYLRPHFATGPPACLSKQQHSAFPFLRLGDQKSLCKNHRGLNDPKSNVGL